MMSIIDELRRIQSADNTETFDRTTDSLEAIRNWLAAGGAGSPGLCYYGVVTNVVNATTFDAALLIGHGDSYFNGYRIYVVRDLAGGGILPQGTGRACTAYVSATGRFTSVAFVAALTVGDEILLIHSSLTGKLVAAGALTASSTVQPADNLRAEADQWFRGCTIQMLSGPCADQTRAIVYYTGAGGIFTLDTANPFTALPVVGSAYVVWGSDFPVCPGINATPSLTPGDVIGNKGDVASIAATASIIALLRYAISSGIGLQAIFNLINAQLTLQETGGQLLATGGVDVVYQVLAPMGIFKPIAVKIDTTNMQAGDTMHLTVSEQISGVGGPIVSDVMSYAGVQAVPLKTIHLDPNRFSILVTLHQDAGVARVYDWSASWES